MSKLRTHDENAKLVLSYGSSKSWTRQARTQSSVLKTKLFLNFTLNLKLQVFNLKDLPSGVCSGSLYIYKRDKDHVFTESVESIAGMGSVDCDK